MPDMYIQDPLLPGHTKASIPQECPSSVYFPLLNLDLTAIVSKRVFILGPSHHYFVDGCALSRCAKYETPIGELPLDLDSVSLINYFYMPSSDINSHP